ncbi:ABC transporter substrate-binding protein [Pseudonocardia alni]|uniref:Peptide/nickel transport system substrate-binding protein n=1 Tax=Pseudonocardia alni TaxID=33907 RepID=A0A852W7I5_PSEA5|nr:ABC transporter substrate-binding protein [Pseudonocardia antarctica]NYG03341.1 peptide/nickel transport system substrate-binding protein [Pseudonocardia antarctica]
MQLSRRSFLRAAGASAALAGIPALAACGAPADAASPRLVTSFAGTGPLGAPDPHRVWRPVDRARAAAVADTLLVWDQDMTPRPHLAASAAPDRTGTRWRIRLRDAAAHDGRPLAPADVLASLRRVLDPATGATAAPLLAHLDLTASRAVSATEVELVLGRPDFLFALALAAPGTGIVRGGRGDVPVGTGAFRFLPGSPDALYRHDGHWAGRPPAPAVEFLVDDDEENRYQSLVDGYVHWAHDLFPHSARRLLGRTGTTVLPAPGSVTRFLDTGPGPLAEPRLREAVRLGIDRVELVRQILLDLGQPGDDLFGAGLAHHPGGLAPVVRDVARARELVVAAGADGARVPLFFDPFDPMSRPTADLVVEQLAAVGLRCEPREPEPPDVEPTPGIRFRRAAAQPIPLYLQAVAAAPWVPGDDTAGDTGDDTATDGAAGPETGGATGSGDAAGGRPDVRALLAVAARAPDEARRTDALRRAQLLLRTDATAWSVGDEHVGVTADLSGVGPARPDTGTWARFHRARLG